MLFIDNKYTRIYYELINHAKPRRLDGYKEKHHIIPKSLGGTNKKENIVELTAREHFICHKLLTKMTNDKRMRLALLAMTRASKTQERIKINSRIFQQIRQAASESMKGENNPHFGKTHSDETRNIIRSKVLKAREEGRCIISHSDISKQKISNANKGNKHSEQTKKNWSAIRKGRPGIDNNSGRSWFNNGVRSVLRYECPEGYVKGRLSY